MRDAASVTRFLQRTFNFRSRPTRGDASDQIRDTFAYFGRALFFAQCVEKQLAILIGSTFKPECLRSSPEERDAYFDAEFGKTLGKLIATLRASVPLPGSLEGRLTRAWFLRNWLETPAIGRGLVVC